MILLKNKFDYFLRSQFRWEREIPRESPVPVIEKKFQDEVSGFFSLLNLKSEIKENKKYRVVDVGTKNFALAPVFDQLFLDRRCDVEVHGVEVDAYRRLHDGYTRHDYARYFSKKARNATFHAQDFLKFQKSCDFVFLLNPFVSREPLLAWGLPLDFLKPQQMFEHVKSILRDRRGVLILSHPSEEEFQIGCSLAKEAGFELGAPVIWRPERECVQRKPRWGCVGRISGEEK